MSLFNDKYSDKSTIPPQPIMIIFRIYKNQFQSSINLPCYIILALNMLFIGRGKLVETRNGNNFIGDEIDSEHVLRKIEIFLVGPAEDVPLKF